jgi:hypothetical protein
MVSGVLKKIKMDALMNLKRAFHWMQKISFSRCLKSIYEEMQWKYSFLDRTFYNKWDKYF